MKTEAAKQLIQPPLQVAESIPKEPSGLRLIHKNETGNPLHPQERNRTAESKPEWDPSWFANYE